PKNRAFTVFQGKLHFTHMHEIITIQFGHFPNFIGTHFWNTQEAYFLYDDYYGTASNSPEISHDVLFRVGVTEGVGLETYTPRLIIYELKGGLGSMSRRNRLYDDSSMKVQSLTKTWDWGIEKHVNEPYNKNEFLRDLEAEEETSTLPIEQEAPTEEIIYNLEDSVKVWSDFNRVYYHPKTVNQINQYQFDDEFMPFDVFSYGQECFVQHEKEESTFDDNFRFFAEECDTIQGIQIFTDILDGFGGFSCNFLEQLRQEYPKNAILTYGITNSQRLTSPQYSLEHYHKQTLNTAFSVVQLNELSSFYVPLTTPVQESRIFKYIRPNLHLPYHSSAILSAAIETTSLAFRLRHGFMSMIDLLGQLNWRGNTKIGNLDSAFPLCGDTDVESLLDDQTGLIEDLSIRVENEAKVAVFGQSIVLRGFPDSSASVSEIRSSILQKFEQSGCPKTLRLLINLINFKFESHTTKLPYPIPNSYPQFFDHLNMTGYVDFDRYLNVLPQINFNLYPQYGEGARGLTQDSFVELKEAMFDLCDIYEEES
ncbi:11007_t:CDS:10, partial [Ambispora leptoticha]